MVQAKFLKEAIRYSKLLGDEIDIELVKEGYQRLLDQDFDKQKVNNYDDIESGH